MPPRCPKGSFYNHFESKDALGVEVVEHYAAKGAERRQALVGGTGAPLARLRAYFKTLNQLGPATGFSRGCLLGNFSAELSSQSADIRAALDEALADWTKDIAQVIAEAQKAGDVRRDIPAATLAAFLLNAWEGAVLRSRSRRARRRSTPSCPSPSTKFSPDTGKLARRRDPAHPL